MMVTIVLFCCVLEREGGREGGYLSVSCALHCPGQTELAYSASVSAQAGCPPVTLPVTSSPGCGTVRLSDKYKYYNFTVHTPDQVMPIIEPGQD